ncbi:MAG TPA: ATP-dependent DNA ligase [Parafilimonas sp.]|nr:ATP-dependent DNA ligase [Parafilimonas sp.]
MKGFANLVQILGTSIKTNEKLDALVNYFSLADDKDRVWVIALFSGRRPRRLVNSSLLPQWCIEIRNIPGWLFGECYGSVGDLAETIALLLPEATEEEAHSSLSFYIEKLVTLEKENELVKRDFITGCWRAMNKDERFVFNKLLTGNFRIGVSQKLMVNALAKTVKLEPSVIAHRISGNWDPMTTSFDELLSEQSTAADYSKPYPFYLAYALEENPETLGEAHEWQAEWKWDGIRGEIIKRNQELFVWSRGEELMTDKFPEYAILRQKLPEGVALDGEIISLTNATVHTNEFTILPFALLQTRIGRKNVTSKQLKESPVGFIAYDLLEFEGEDYRNRTLEERRLQLEKIIAEANEPVLRLSPVINFNNWDELAATRATSRDINAEGIMLKRKTSIYQVGRKVGDWWKWKIDPLTIDAVMIYAQKGSGRRSTLYTDYTFAVKDEDKLVAFTKAYSGLTDKEFAQVDAFVKRNSLEKFGPVRTVKPELVFEIAFEGIAASNRHKSGVALRFPRIKRWRKDKKPGEINTLDDLKQMLEAYGK